MSEFTIKALPEYEFRCAYVSPVELLALTTQVDFDKFNQTALLFKYALEHLECKMGEKWVPVKNKDKEVYMPLEIQTNMTAMNELISWFLANVVAPAFPKSGE